MYEIPEHLATPHTAYGITVHHLGEDGEFLAAFGHHDKRRFTAACNDYDRSWVGRGTLDDYDDATWTEIESEISHDHAKFDPSPEEAGRDWCLWFGQPEGSGTHAVTVWRLPS